MLAAVMLAAVTGCTAKKPVFLETTEPTTSNIVRVTFPEGSTVSQIATLLEQNGVCPAAEFMAEANNPGNLEGFAFDIPDSDERAFLLEGYIFPDTYDFYRNESPSSAIRRFLKNSAEKFDEEILARCNELGYTLDEILTIASIIQEEAGNPAEMGKVSSVIHNRLDSRSFPKLQCDVTIVYLKDYVKPYIDEARYALLTELYNTYKCENLPAGPITNSGIDAVSAALYPEDTEYYFFVTDSEGIYHYAETWEEHVENCDKAGL